jgi:hypothetical protein
MLQRYLDLCHEFANTPGEFYAGSRKILRDRKVIFEADDIKPDLELKHAGYTKSKMTALVRDYVHVESRDFALKLWEKRLEQGSYGSVGFSCYNHLIKASSGVNRRASTHGPCIQAVSITLIKDRRAVVDIFYRTTELFKKYPADLVFVRDVLLPGFDMDLEMITFHLANVSVHPMFYVTIVPELKDPIKHLKSIKRHDAKYHRLVVANLTRYLVPGHSRGHEMWSQFKRTKEAALKRMDQKILVALQAYLLAHFDGSNP